MGSNNQEARDGFPWEQRGTSNPRGDGEVPAVSSSQVSDPLKFRSLLRHTSPPARRLGETGRQPSWVRNIMAQFLIKIVNHFASEVITKRLANSRAFQQFAMKTHLKVSRVTHHQCVCVREKERERTGKGRGKVTHPSGEARLRLPVRSDSVVSPLPFTRGRIPTRYIFIAPLPTKAYATDTLSRPQGTTDVVHTTNGIFSRVSSRTYVAHTSIFPPLSCPGSAMLVVLVDGGHGRTPPSLVFNCCPLPPCSVHTLRGVACGGTGLCVQFRVLGFV